MGNLDKHLAEMQRQGYGVSYGRYQMDHLQAPVPVKPHDEEPEDSEDKRPCSFCGKLYVPANKFVRYCSDDCRERRRKQAYIETYESTAPRELISCSICGEPFLPRRKNIVYCSPKCSKRGWYLNKKAKLAEKEE